MEPFVSDPDFQLYVGDALEVLRGLPDESVHCCVTSPPYWALRDYGTGTWEGGDPDCDHARQSDVSRASSGLHGATTTQGGVYAWKDVCGRCGATRVDRQLGLEPTPDEYVAAIVAVFREVRRVLRSDGTLWLNLGDSYASSPSGQNQNSESLQAWGGGAHKPADRFGAAARRPVAAGLKPKDLVGIPWRVAFALQADGWYLRSAITWCKPSAMPESVTDRPSKATEMVFLLTKSARYFYDASAVAEPSVSTGRTNGATSGGSTLRPEVRATLRTHDGTTDSWGWCDLGETKHAVDLPVAGQTSHFQVLEPVGVQVGVKAAERDLVMYLKSASLPAVDAGVSVAVERAATLLGPVWAAVVDAAASPSGAVLASSGVSAEPLAATLASAEVMRLELAAVLPEGGAALVTLQLQEVRATLLVWGSFTTSHTADSIPAGTRNLRDYWVMNTQPFADAHFATFPEALPDRCIRAGTSERGCCPVCGAPWVREIEREEVVQTRRQNLGVARAGGVNEQPRAGGNSGLVAAGFGAQFPRTTIGWRPSCECVYNTTTQDEGGHNYQDQVTPDPAPCTVLDPFGGSGTTALVARRLGRRSVLIELSPEYAELAARRLQQLSLLAEGAA